jgi:hypothetical protein
MNSILLSLLLAAPSQAAPRFRDLDAAKTYTSSASIVNVINGGSMTATGLSLNIAESARGRLVARATIQSTSPKQAAFLSLWQDGKAISPEYEVWLATAATAERRISAPLFLAPGQHQVNLQVRACDSILVVKAALAAIIYP